MLRGTRGELRTLGKHSETVNDPSDLPNETHAFTPTCNLGSEVGQQQS